MLGYVVRRLLMAVPVMGVVAVIVFSLLYLTPGDPAQVLAGDTATPEQIEKIRTALGLDEPPHLRFLRLAVADRARRSRRLDLQRRAGGLHDRPAPAADLLAAGCSPC